MESSDTESDISAVSVVSEVSNASRRSTRSNGSRRVSYTYFSEESDNEDYILKRRLEDILGEDSGSDKEYQPEFKKKKENIYLDNQENEEHILPDNTYDSQSFGSISERTAKAPSETNSEYGAVPDTVSEPVPGEEKNQKDQRVRRRFGVKKRTRTYSNSTLGVTSIESGGGSVRRTRSPYDDLSELFTRPSVLKKIEGPGFRSRVKTNKKEGDQLTTRWKCFCAELERNLRMLKGRGETSSTCSLIFSALTSDVQLFSSKSNQMNTYVQNNRYVNDSLGYMVLDCINTHISSPHLRAEIHKSFGEIVCGWTWFEGVLSTCLIHLVNLGAVEAANSLSLMAKLNSKHRHVSEELRILKTMLEMISVQEKVESNRMNETTSHMNILSEAVIMDMNELLEKSKGNFDFILPLYSWYLTEYRDVEGCVKLLTWYTKQNPTSLRAHETLVAFLKDQQCEEETILSALESGSSEFPHEQFVVQYCQALLRKDENLDESLGSNDDESLPTATGGLDHAGIVEKIVGFLDLKENMTNIEAWDLLVNSVLQVVQTLNQPDTVLDIFNTRLNWWFDQSCEDLINCPTHLLGRKLVLLNLLFGEKNKYSDLVKACLQERLEGGDRTVNSVLAESKLYQRTRTEPIIVLNPTETDDHQGWVEDEWSRVEIIRKESEYLSRSEWIRTVESSSEGREYSNLDTWLKKRKEYIHLVSPIYLKNFLYMSRADQQKLIAKYVQETYSSQTKETSKKGSSIQKPEIILYPHRFIPLITRILQRNLVEKKVLSLILVEEKVELLNQERRVRAFFQTPLNRMKKFIDWSRVDYVLALDPPSDINLGSEIKTIFLRRLKSVINTKLNPRLGVQIALDEIKSKVGSSNQEKKNSQFNNWIKYAEFLQENL
ncbi:uncharacterized protein LOC111697213 [Eurytemora carolleeae]|uniref:uncharacterized protein LOC111697213 n=1 Tax=Eurytemora carolleeae TaxID=1294199 RepID=UPI000C78A53B|nr:uncharacterized protein LOC111697213 [Eurytemora carolleeae]|eukprot:XP_023322888.1 uncharacterized protein LOC111697213 [Eurytemora affinis]